ncbi:MAG: cardiolipin synthase [Deltaproteobacteria bacterium HGW-Deltaproteobacteria-4]|nr:MAG: cardiolipin synthase [Deltaproteobacteria bacterium HGW-Deltaproteobacteria-4]
MIDEAPAAQKLRPITSARGELSPRQSKALMERLQHSVEPMKILERHTTVVESITESPLTGGNKVSLLADGQATYAAMFKALESAKDHINLESYIIEDGEIGHQFADLLLKKQRQGVQVHIIYDSLGSMLTPDAFFQRLRDEGIQVVAFNPVNPLTVGKKWGLSPHRDHRKILIVDGKVAILGGINISNVYSSTPFNRGKNEKIPIHWRDTDVQIEGPAVAELQKLFLDTWMMQREAKPALRDYFPAPQEEGSALVRVIGSTPGESNRVPFIVYVLAISLAEKSIHLTNSYFFPDEQIIKALTDAARRGVDVKVILPGITDSLLALHAQRSYYSKLLRAGVQLYEHSNSLLHAKTAVIDSVWATVGSTNMDYLSLLNNNEVNAIILSKEFAGEMEQMFNGDLLNSKQIHWEEWKKRPLLPRTREWFVSLFVRWL